MNDGSICSLILTRQNLETFAAVINEKGAALDNCSGFIDGTVRPVSRLGRHQRILYNGHMKIHAIKFHSIAIQPLQAW